MSAERNADRMERAWLSYRERVLASSISSIQLIETRRAFYAGAWALYTVQMTMFDAGAEPTEGDQQKLASIVAELERFCDRVKAGLA